MPYIVPQEHGHHPDTRWLTLTDDAGFGLEVRGRPTIGFGASHFTAADLTAARHTNELEPRAEVLLSLDHAQRGLGTASCGPDTAERYRLLEPRYSFGYVLRPIAAHWPTLAPRRRDGDERSAVASRALAVRGRHGGREARRRARPR